MLAANYRSFLLSLTRHGRLLRLTLLLTASAGAGCGGDEENAPAKAQIGGACTGADTDECEAALSCEPRADSDERVCGKPLMVAGTLTDALTTDPIANALVFVMDQTGAPIAQAKTNAEGEYEVVISTARKPDGSVAKDISWTIAASAQAT
jgi:hypothetical protein